MTGLEIAEWAVVPVVVIGAITYNVLDSHKGRRRERQAWQAIAAETGGTLTEDRKRLGMQIPVEGQTLTVDTYSVTHTVGGEGAVSHTEHYTRFSIPCLPSAPLRFALIERTPGQSLSIAAMRLIGHRPDRPESLPEIPLGDLAFDRVFRLLADPPETVRALLTPLTSPLSALRYVIWQYNSVPQPSAVASALTMDVTKIGRAKTGKPSDAPGWVLSATVNGRLTDSDEFQEIITTLTALYHAMRRLKIVTDPTPNKTSD